jgi:plastocyanin domain-containing protein
MKGIVSGLAVLAVLAGCAPQSRQGVADNGRVAISVTENGFEPATVTVPVGKPVTLVVTRTTAKTCATDFVMAARGINRPLPLGQAVEISFTPDKAGELDYACAMDMYKGKVIVK